MACATATFVLDRSGLLREGLHRLLQDTCYDPVYCGDVLPQSGFVAKSPFSQSLVILGPDVARATLVSLEPRCHDRAYRIVVLLHAYSERQTIEEFRAIADAFLLTTVSAGLLVKALDLIMEGVSVMPSELVAMVNRTPSSIEGDILPVPAAVGRSVEASQASSFSEREILVLRRLMEGASNKIIARDLGIAEATVKVHVKAIFRKACLRNRTQVALWATRQKLAGGRLWPSRPELAFPGDAPIGAKPALEPLISAPDLGRAA